MSTKLVDDIADAVMYEGYLLYPYRASAVKNRQRWNFGVLYPRAFSEAQLGTDAWMMQTECLARTTVMPAALSIRVRFLHLIERTADGQSWQEAAPCEINVPKLYLTELALHPARHLFTFPATSETEGRISPRREQIQGAIDAEAESLQDGLFKLRVGISNTTAFVDKIGMARDAALMHSLVSTHTILVIDGGEFVSLLDPPLDLRDIAAQCRNIGTFPVLAGEDGQRDTMLSSPIILYDYPQIAPESAGALFDATEIDEILTLRIMTLTDDEKLEMHGDDRARKILERTESMPPEQLMKMHGALRGLRRVSREEP